MNTDNEGHGPTEMPIPVTVVLRSYNDAALLPATLAALDRQRGVDVSLLVFESASTDGSKEILDRHGYARIEHLKPGSYHSATVLNQGVAWAETELVAFLNSDAIMMRDDVLLSLARPMVDDARCGGTFARQIPRPDASAITRLDHFVAFEQRAQLGHFQDYLSLVTSMIRRAAWENNRFDSALTFAEDYVWSARAKAQGWTLRYVYDAVVEHSHDYDADELFRRNYGDSAALAMIADGPPPTDQLRGVLLPLAKRLARDTYRLARMGELPSAWRLPKTRWAASRGAWSGAKDGWRVLRSEAAEAGAKQPTRRR